jgi:hypothetical protein
MNKRSNPRKKALEIMDELLRQSDRLSTADVCKILNKSVSHISQLIYKEQLTYDAKIGTKRVFTRQDIEDYYFHKEILPKMTSKEREKHLRNSQVGTVEGGQAIMSVKAYSQYRLFMEEMTLKYAEK